MNSLYEEHEKLVDRLVSLPGISAIASRLELRGVRVRADAEDGNPEIIRRIRSAFETLDAPLDMQLLNSNGGNVPADTEHPYGLEIIANNGDGLPVQEMAEALSSEFGHDRIPY